MTAPARIRRGPLSASYLTFVSATGLSSLGDAAWMLALTTTLITVSSATTAGLLVALAGVPRVIALLGGGVAADRYGPVKVMVWTDLARCAVMVAAAGVVLVVEPTAAVLAVVAAALTVLGAFFVPASGALRPLLLPDEHLVRGNALYLIGLRTGQAAGGPVGAALLGLGGVAAVAVANAASFLVSAAAVARSRPEGPVPRRERIAIRTSIAEGLRHVAGDPALRTLVLVVGLVELAAAGPVNIGLVLLAHSIGAGAPGAGLLLTAFTVGATVAFLFTLARPVGRHAGPLLVLAVCAQALALGALGVLGTLPALLGGYGVLGLLTALSGVVLTSLIQRRTPAPVRGRVMSIMSLVVFGAPLLGNALIGVSIDLFGITTTMALHALSALVAVCVYASSPVLRGARLD